MSTNTGKDASKASMMIFNAFPATNVNKIWENLKKAFIEILKKNNSDLSFEELYRDAYPMVLQKHGEKLYNGTKQVVTEHLYNVRDEIVRHLNSNFLSYLNQCWKDHQTAMIMIRDILIHMDHVYVMQNDKETVYNMGLIIFSNIILRHLPIQEKLQNNLLNIIAQERKGEVVLNSKIKDACQMLIQLRINSTSIYEVLLEKVYLEQFTEFYRMEGERLLSENISSISYITRVNQIIEDESKRAKLYLDPSTEPKIVKVLEEELISRHLGAIVNRENSGLNKLLHQNSFSEIASMFKLLNRVENGLQSMNKCISFFIREQGRNIVSDKTLSPLSYISELFLLREKADTLLSEALDNHVLFRDQINADFEIFINFNVHSSEYLSIFIDEKLHRRMKGLDNPELDAIFDKCILIYRYLHDKDIFEQYYKRHLARRLLRMNSRSNDQEKAMISKLNIECDGAFTSKLEGMLKDMVASKTLMDEWSKSVKSDTEFNMDVFVRILTAGLWPTLTLKININLPEEAKLAFDAYSRFYLSKHNGRVINLQPNLGSVELLAVFESPISISSPTILIGGCYTLKTDIGTPIERICSTIPTCESSSSFSQKSNSDGDRVSMINSGTNGINSFAELPSTVMRKYLLKVSTYQMIILMNFNKKNKFTLEELSKETNIPENALIKSLLSLSLSDASQKILSKEPKSKSIELLPSDSFTVDETFYSKHYKVKVKTVLSKETEPERKATEIRLDENRKYVIEATIVRIMKARQCITHNLLITEVTEKLKSRFLPMRRIIKQRIESLIDRDYIVRSDDDRKMYKYLA